MPGLLNLQLSMRLIILLHCPFDHSVFWIHSHETVIFTVRGTGHGIPLHSFKGGKKDNGKVTKKINSIRNASASHVCYTKGLCQALSQQTPSQGHGFCKDLKQAAHGLGTSHSPLAQHFPRPFNLLPLSALLLPTNCTREKKQPKSCWRKPLLPCWAREGITVLHWWPWLVCTVGTGSDGERDLHQIKSNPKQNRMEGTALQPLLPRKTSFASKPALPQATSQQHAGWGGGVSLSPTPLTPPLVSFFFFLIKYLHVVLTDSRWGKKNPHRIYCCWKAGISNIASPAIQNILSIR